MEAGGDKQGGAPSRPCPSELNTESRWICSKQSRWNKWVSKIRLFLKADFMNEDAGFLLILLFCNISFVMWEPKFLKSCIFSQRYLPLLSQFLALFKVRKMVVKYIYTYNTKNKNKNFIRSYEIRTGNILLSWYCCQRIIAPSGILKITSPAQLILNVLVDVLVPLPGGDICLR